MPGWFLKWGKKVTSPTLNCASKSTQKHPIQVEILIENRAIEFKCFFNIIQLGKDKTSPQSYSWRQVKSHHENTAIYCIFLKFMVANKNNSEHWPKLLGTNTVYLLVNCSVKFFFDYLWKLHAQNKSSCLPSLNPNVLRVC